MDFSNVQGISMKKYQSKIKQARKPLISALEPRLLLDGAAVATAVDILTDTQLQNVEDQVTSIADNALAPTEVRTVDASLNNGRKEVVFIDTNIDNYQSLIEGIDDGIEIQLIDSSQDGLAQMAVWAETHSDYDAIHILSHGSEGQIELGSATLNTESLESYNAELTLLGESLNEEGDLLLYGCEVSLGDDQSFIEQLSLITGADVAASDDLTGSALLGGDWELEKSIGVINSDSIESDVYELTLSDNNAPVFSAGSGAGAAATQVSVFSYPNLNGSDSNPGSSNENANLASIIQSVINDGGAYTLDTSIQNFTDDDFEDKLNESGFFFMTDMESQNPNSDSFLPDSAQSIIESWVNDGGVIMMTGTAGSYDTSFLNNIFDWDLTTQSGSNWSLNEGNAAGTPFEGGPTSLSAPSATDSIGSGTVEGFTSIYGTDDNATVATIEYGSGTIIFLGYDFYASGVSGTGFTDTATQYGNDVTTGGSNSNDWVQEIVPRALEYSANLASSSYELSANGSQLTLDSDLIVSDSDTSDSVTLSVSSVTAVQQTEGSDAVTLSDDEAAAYESMLVIANENALDSETSTTTVDWSFDSGNEAFNTLAGNESLVLTYVIEAEDSNGATATTEIKITINGLNDSPDIQVVDVVGTVEEGSSLTDSGSVTFTDVDLTDNPTATETTSSVTALAQGGETALTLTSAQQATIEAAFSIENVNTNANDGTVNWAYDISETNLDFLGEGEVVTAVFTITVTDDEGATDTQDVTITLTGSNDAPDIQVDAETGSVTGTITEGLTLTDSGSVTFTDVDLTDNPVATEATSSVTAVAQGGETALTLTSAQQAAIEAAFSIENVNTNANDGTVNWAYDISETNLDFLGEGEVVTAVFTITVTDDEGATDTQDVTITLTGSNDAPDIQVDAETGSVTGTITEGTTLTDSGSITFTDVDLTDTPTATEVTKSVTAIAQDGEAALTLTSAQQAAIEAAFSIENVDTNNNDGTVNWSYNISEANLDFLGAGEVVTAVFTITVTDDEGSTDTQEVTITLTGNDNSAPIFETDESASSGNTQVSVFSYPNLNGSDSNPGSGNENANLASIIQSVINDGGEYTLDTSIQNFTDDDFEDKLNESGFFFMTDMERGDPNSEVFLPESAQSTIASWVNDGGVIMMTGTYSSNDTDFLNNIFDWDLTTQSGSNWSLNEGNAAGTPFEGGPTSLSAPSATDSIGSGTVEGFTSIYGTDDNATVATIEYGSGTIIFLGYDFYASGVSGTGFTDTATQYGNDVTTGSSNSNDWVQEIVPRALEYSATLSNSSYELSADGSQLTLDSDLVVSDSDISNSVTLAVSTVTVMLQSESGESEAVVLSDSDLTLYENMFSIANEDAIDTSSSSATVEWSFDSQDETFDFVAGNESLILTYQIEAEDSLGATATTDITITINGLNDAPDIQVVDVTGNITEGTTLTDNGSVTFTDVDLTDTPTATEATSTVTALAQDGTTALVLTSAQQSAIEAAFSIENVNANTNDGTVNWTYNISEANLDFLGEGEVVTAVFTITVTDDEGVTDTQDVTITLTGSNDSPDIQVVDVTGAITEGSTLTDSGSVTFTDVDLTDGPIATEATSSVTAIAQDGETALTLTGTQQAAIEAAFSIENVSANNNDGTVNWTYNISEANLDFLGEGELVTVVFTITVTDDEDATDTQDVTITLTGSNDSPDIQVDAETGSVTGTIAEGTTLTDTGSVTFTDVDLTDGPIATEATSTVTAIAQDGETALTLTSAQQTAIEAAFNIENVSANNNDGTVNWTYDISESNLNFLGEGEVVTAVFTITVTDDEGATDTQDVTITLTGTNDTPDIQVVDVTGAITEGTTLTDNGSVTFTDLDLTDNPTATETTSSVTALAQDGTTALVLTSAQQTAIEAAFSIENVNTNTNDGTVNWNYDISEANLDFLGEGEVVTAVFTITVTDDEGATDTQDVTITLVGDNDTPVAIASLPSISGTSSLLFEPVTLAGSLFEDADFGETQTLTYSIEGLPDGLVFNVNTLTISGVATSGFEGVNLLHLVATDIHGAQAKIPILLTLESAPVAIGPNLDTSDSVSIPTIGFSAPDVNLNIDALPSGTFGEGIDSKGFSSEANDSQSTPEPAADSSVSNPANSGVTANQNNVQVFESQVSVNVDASGQVQITQGDSLDSGSNLSVADIVTQDVGVDIKLSDIGIGSSFTATLSDGTALPSWVEVDPNTGDVFMDPPEGQGNISLKINAVGTDGITRVLEIEIDLDSLPESASTNAVELETVTDTKEDHMTFDQQVELAGNGQDNYGSDLMKLLAS